MAKADRFAAIVDLFDLSGQTAIVTGAGQGMGRGIASRLADAGARLVVAGRTLSKCEKVAAAIRESGLEAIAVACDVTSLEDLDNTVAQAMAAFGRIDILVNNAGGTAEARVPPLHFDNRCDQFWARPFRAWLPPPRREEQPILTIH